MRILITGSSGFIGTHLTQELLACGHEIFPLDLKRDQDCGDPEYFDERLYEDEPDIVVHLAAKVGRLFGEDDVQRTIYDNAAITANVAQLCGKHGVKLVYASTSEVYGDQGTDECNENNIRADLLPHNIYGLSKRWGEEACRLYAPNELLIWRISMPYGPGLPAGIGRAAIINMLYQAHHGLPIPVHRGAERSWCWIGDTVAAMRITIEKWLSGPFNIGRDDEPTPMVNVAQRACSIANASWRLIDMVDAPNRQTVVKRLGTSKIRGTGWEPQVDLADGMAQTYEWVKSLPAPVAVAA